MKSNTNPVGVFTTDSSLTIRMWDPTLARFTGISAESATGRLLVEVIPDLESRGLIQHFTRALQEGVVKVLVPAFHKYLIRCAPSTPSAHFPHMRQRVTIAPLEDGGSIEGLIVTVEDVTARDNRERYDHGQSQAGLSTESIRPADLGARLEDESSRVRRSAAAEVVRSAGTDTITILLRAVRDT